METFFKGLLFELCCFCCNAIVLLMKHVLIDYLMPAKLQLIMYEFQEWKSLPSPEGGSGGSPAESVSARQCMAPAGSQYLAVYYPPIHIKYMVEYSHIVLWTHHSTTALQCTLQYTQNVRLQLGVNILQSTSHLIHKDFKQKY